MSIKTRTFLALHFFLFISSNLSAEVVWQYISDYTNSEAHCITESFDNNFIIGGETINRYSEHKIMLVKINTDGGHIWEWLLNTGQYYQQIKSVIPVDNDKYIGAYNNIHNPCITKVNSQGNLDWQRTYDLPHPQYIYHGVPTTDNGFIFTGYTANGFIGTDIFILKVDEQGLTNGSGYWFKTIIRTNHAEYAYHIKNTPDNGYIIAGASLKPQGSYRDFYTVKLNPEGDVEWTRTLGGPYEDKAISLCITPDNNYIIVGNIFTSASEGWNIYLVKLDNTGNVIWTKSFGGTDNDIGSDIQITSDNGYIIAGYIHSEETGEKQSYLLKTDKDGNMEWEKIFNNTRTNIFNSVKEISQDKYVMSGSCNGFLSLTCYAHHAQKDCSLINTDIIENNQTQSKNPILAPNPFNYKEQEDLTFHNTQEIIQIEIYSLNRQKIITLNNYNKRDVIVWDIKQTALISRGYYIVKYIYENNQVNYSTLIIKK